MTKRTGYHHGNLRAALLDAARSLIETKGTGGFTLAEAARNAGVSPGAPYRHFKDRNDILGALALEGFELFAERLETAWEHGRPDAMTAFARVGRAYLKFAQEDPAAYRAMFDTELAPDDVPGLRRASGRAFDALRTCCAALIERVPPARRPPVDLMSVHLWSISHGTATLFARPGGARGRVPVSPEDVLESNTLIYLRGLGVPPGD
ncbi:MAG: TetR/AcrR family transcriptional regulator [Pseudomonadota bacterium]